MRGENRGDEGDQKRRGPEEKGGERIVGMKGTRREKGIKVEGTRRGGEGMKGTGS